MNRKKVALAAITGMLLAMFLALPMPVEAGEAIIPANHTAYIKSIQRNGIDANQLIITNMNEVAFVEGISMDPATLGSGGGESLITISGKNLSDGILVAAFEGDIITPISGTTTGTETEQKAILTFPANLDTITDKTFVIKVSFDGGSNWIANTEMVTVARASSNAVTEETVKVKPIALAPSSSSTMTGINLSEGYLEPNFDASITEYTVIVNATVSAIIVTPSFSDMSSVVTINGQLTPTGSGYSMALMSGLSTIQIQVDTADQVNRTTYTLSIYRQVGVWENLRGAVINNCITAPTNLDFAFIGGNPYISYCTDRVNVSYFNKNAWITMPAVNGMNNTVDDISLRSYNGSLYIAYSGGRFANPVVEWYYAKRKQWESVSPGTLITDGNGYNVTMDMYKGNIYVAYLNWVNNGPLFVKKFDGVPYPNKNWIKSKWVDLGQASTLTASAKALAFKVDDISGTPYLAYIDSESKSLYVSRFNGSTWEIIGSSITAGNSSKVLLSVYHNTPYIALIGDFYQTSGVYKFDGSAWQFLSSQGVSDNSVIVDMVVSDGIPHCLFHNYYNGNTPTLRKYTGSGWETISTIPGGMKIRLCNGIPYVLYKNGQSIYVAKYVIANNAGLSSITIKTGTKSLSLKPKFKPAISTYTVSVPYSVENIKINVNKQDQTAIVTGDGSVSLNYGINLKTLTVLSGNGAVTKTYTLKITRAFPPKPSVNLVSVTPPLSKGFSLDGTNVLRIKARVKTAVPATITATFYDASGKWVAATSLDNQGSGFINFSWDGKATEGNAAQLIAGSYVPVNVTGKKYTIKISVTIPGSTKYSRATAIKLYGDPAMSK